MYDERQLLEEFTRLAGILRACGGRFFSGDASLWSELEAQRRERAQSEEDKRALLLSEQAFHRQNWQHVVSILEPMAARLSKAATARHSYAKKKLKNTT